MEKLIENIKKDDAKDIYELYLDVVKLIGELEDGIKELPPKEEL